MEQMPAMPQSVEQTENTAEKTFKQKLERKLKHLVTLGFTVSTLLISACSSNESSAVHGQEAGDSKESALFIKSKLDAAQYGELKKLDHTVDSLSLALFAELKEKNLIPSDAEESSYKNWHFRKANEIDISWSEKDENQKTKEGYEYIPMVSETTTPGHTSREIHGQISHYSNTESKGEEFSDYSYYGGSDAKSLEIWKSKAHALSAEQVKDHASDDLNHEMTSTLTAFKEKLETELTTINGGK